MRRLLLSALTLSLFSAATLHADNWPNWRGPLNNGVCTEKNLPVSWSPTENVAWKVSLPGPAGATPVIWENRIFLTSTDGQDLLLMAFDTSGSELWRRKVGRGNQDARGDEGNSCSPSPLTDGKYVWSFMGTGDLGCYDFDGNEIYKFNLQDRYGKFDIQFGMTSTPVLDDDKLIFQLIHGKWNRDPQPAWVVAINKHDGKEIWKHLRESDAFAENVHSYASPVIYRDSKTKFLITHGADYVIAHNLETGDELWRHGGLNPKDKYNEFLRLVASPSFAEGIIVVPSAKNGPVLAVMPSGKGNMTDRSEVYHWKRDRDTPDVPSPVIADGIVYLCRENGNLLAVEAKTGKELYLERTHNVRHRASPVYADGHVYLTGRDGHITVVKAGPTFEIAANNVMGDEMSSSPAISNGTIYLRTFGHLWAIRK